MGCPLNLYLSKKLGKYFKLSFFRAERWISFSFLIVKICFKWYCCELNSDQLYDGSLIQNF